MDKKYYTVIIGEEVGTKLKSFLIAPVHTFIHVGDLVVANNMKFHALYVDDFCAADGTEMTLLRVALGRPYKVVTAIKEEPIKWEDSEDVLDG